MGQENYVNVTRTRNCYGWPSSPPCTQCVMSLLNDAYSIGLTLQIFPHAMKLQQFFKTGSTLKCPNASGFDLSLLTRSF